MSLSATLGNAVVGLSLTTKRAETIAINVANADRAGYAARSLEAGARGTGRPVTETHVIRTSDARLQADRRAAEAELGEASVGQTFHAALDAAIGDPGTAGSLQDLLSQLDASLLSAGANPSSDAALADVAQSASDVVRKIGAAAELVTRERQAADSQIAATVDQLNADLEEVATVNASIAREGVGSHATADLIDRRTLLIDRINTAIPIRELPRDGGAVALVSQSGQLLLDGDALEIEFSSRAPITDVMEHPTHLSGLSVNGRELSSLGSGSIIAGGELSALFTLRDEIAPEATARLDGFAADLIDRFADPTVDTTLAAGSPGLFTDNGAAYDPMADPGLAGRLALNDAIDPSDTSTHWRLRDGLAAVSADPSASPAQLLRLGSVLTDRALPVSADAPQIVQDVVGHAASLKSLISSDRVRADDRVASAQTEVDTRQAEGDGGAVDIDSELRSLIEIEQAYAANARLVQAVDEMMDQLLRL